MLVGRLAPRACRRLLQHHGARIPSYRSLATDTTDIQANEAALEQHLRLAAAITQNASSSTPSETQPPRRRRRRKDDSPPRDPIVDAYLTHQHMQQTTAPYGSSFAPGYQPSSLLSNPPSPSDVTLELLLASQTHLGHSTSLWNPANSRYIFGIREGIHIISLDTTAQYLRRAAKVVSGVAERGGLILFVGTRPGFDRIVVRAAQLASPACHLFERWTPGSITNGQQILGKCGMRVVDEFDAEVDGFEDQLFGRNALKPDLVVVLNPIENYALLHECALATIPTIGIIDTDADPTWVTYPIPANDDSLRSVQVICGVLGRAGEQGQTKRRDAAVAGRISYRAPEQLNLPEDFDIPAFKQGKESRKAAFRSGLADLTLLTDPSLGSAMSKLNDDEKRSLTEGDEETLQDVQRRLNPQERATLIRHFESEQSMAKALQEATEKEKEEKMKLESRGQSAKERARAAATAAADRKAARRDDTADNAPEETLPDPSSPLEASRRAAAEAYFTRDASSDAPTDGEAEDILSLLQRKLSSDDLAALQASPAAFDLDTVRDKLSDGELAELQTALQQINESALEGEGDVNAESEALGYDGGAYDPEMGSRERPSSSYFSDGYGEDESEGQMGYSEEREQPLSEIDQERRGLGHADEDDLEGTSRNGR